MIQYFHIKENSQVPKYKQLADSIIAHISSGKVGIDTKLPSVKALSSELSLSRETVFKGLNLVSEKGIITSKNRKGYYVTKTNTNIDFRVFFMLDKITSFKEKIYDGLRFNLEKNSEVDIFFHHSNKKVFKSIIIENLNSYTHFVISTFFKEDITDVLNLIPENKLIIIDKYEPNIKKAHSQIFQDFSQDIYNSLCSAHSIISKYSELCLVAPKSAPHRTYVLKGFNQYSNKNKTKCSVIEFAKRNTLKSDTAYLLIGIKNDDLVEIIKFCKENNYTLGNEVGVISYNDTQLKEVLEGGITVISTDFKQMGRRVAAVIKNNEKVIEANSSKLILRKSL